MKILTNFKVFSQNTKLLDYRFVHESVFIIFHEQMNIHEQMNMNNEQYIHANRMTSSPCFTVVPRHGIFVDLRLSVDLHTLPRHVQIRDFHYRYRVHVFVHCPVFRKVQSTCIFYFYRISMYKVQVHQL